MSRLASGAAIHPHQALEAPGLSRSGTAGKTPPGREAGRPCLSTHKAGNPHLTAPTWTNVLPVEAARRSSGMSGQKRREAGDRQGVWVGPSRLGQAGGHSARLRAGQLPRGEREHCDLQLHEARGGVGRGPARHWGDSRSEDRDRASPPRSPAWGETGLARQAHRKSGGPRRHLPLPTRHPLEGDLAPRGGRGHGRLRRMEGGWPSSGGCRDGGCGSSRLGREAAPRLEVPDESATGFVAIGPI